MCVYMCVWCMWNVGVDVGVETQIAAVCFTTQGYNPSHGTLLAHHSLFLSTTFVVSTASLKHTMSDVMLGTCAFRRWLLFLRII